MSQSNTVGFLQRNIAVYRDEAERSRKWAEIRRQDAIQEDERAALFEARADQYEAMLSRALSQGIEARSAEPRSGLAEGESPVAEGHAPNQSQPGSAA